MTDEDVKYYREAFKLALTIIVTIIYDFNTNRLIVAGFWYATGAAGNLHYLFPGLRCATPGLFLIFIVNQVWNIQAGEIWSIQTGVIWIIQAVTTWIPQAGVALWRKIISQLFDRKVEASLPVNAGVARKVYNPLEEGQIRLVRLHSHSSEGAELGDDGDTNISCSLLTVNLDGDPEPPEYEAVSYVWGKHSDPQEIKLNQERFWVTRNLSNALKALRLPDRDRILWIDALAINQLNFLERASQVKEMQRIYSCAGNTLIWLNDGNMHEIERNPLWAHLRSRSGRHQAEDLAPIQTSQQGWNWGDFSSLLSGLSNLQYWHRVWTAQEVVYSRRATLVTPSGSASFGILEHVLRLPEVKVGGPTTRAFETSLKEFKMTCLTLRPNTVSKCINLDTWIQMCTSRNCYDPKDYAYGLCGLFPPAVRQQVKVDYEGSTVEVFQKATLAFLRQDGCLNYLRHSNCFSQLLSWIFGLPSWVPDVSHKRPTNNAIARLELDRVPHPSTSDNEPTETFLETLDDSKVLHVRGRWIGQVENVGGGWADPPQARGETVEARAFELLRFLLVRSFPLDVQYDELDKFCHAFRATESGTTNGIISALPTILEQRCSPGGKQSHWDLESLLSRYQQDLGAEDLLHAYSTVTVLRIRDPNGGRTVFGITWGDGDNAKSGDKVCVLEGCSHALIVRAASPSWWNLWTSYRQGQYSIVGSAVLCGGGSEERNLFKEIRSKNDLVDIFLM